MWSIESNKVFIFSNDQKRYSEEAIESLGIQPHHLLVLLNRGYPIRYNKVVNHEHKVVYLRQKEWPKNEKYWGLKWLQHYFYKQVFFLGGARHNPPSDFRTEPYWYPKDMFPSTGFLVAWYYTNIVDTTLVNFSHDGHTWWEKHHLAFERDQIKQWGVKQITF